MTETTRWGSDATPRFQLHSDEIAWSYWRKATVEARERIGRAREWERTLRNLIEKDDHPIMVTAALKLIASELALADDALATALGENIR